MNGGEGAGGVGGGVAGGRLVNGGEGVGSPALLRVEGEEAGGEGVLERWYCVRTQSKREHVASVWLRERLGIETYLPRIRYRRVEARRRVWTTEALFPNYLFARCDLDRDWQRVGWVPGVIELVRFGQECPAIEDEVIEGLRERTGDGDVRVIEDEFEPGDAVSVACGPFQGLEAVVTRVMPSRERVRVLLEFLGRAISVELGAGEVAGERDVRERVVGAGNGRRGRGDYE